MTLLPTEGGSGGSGLYPSAENTPETGTDYAPSGREAAVLE
jgi:hypothetical protein